MAGATEAVGREPGRRGSRPEVLHQLDRANLFVVPLDDRREWYRYHHLFGELLQHELAAAEPELAPVEAQ